MPRDSNSPRGPFPETRHSVVARMGDADPQVRRRAADAVVGAYWKPVYKYVRLKWRADEDEAQDLTQGFFVSALERELLERFEPGRARFRTYLRTCLDSFVLNERKAATRLKRGGGYEQVRLDFQDAENELQHGAIAAEAKGFDPDVYFHREWMRSLLALAVQDLRRHCEEAGRQHQFELLRRYDLSDDEGQRPTYAEMAAELGVEVTKVTNDLHAARKRFRSLLMERLRDLCSSEDEYQEELRSLLGGGTA